MTGNRSLNPACFTCPVLEHTAGAGYDMDPMLCIIERHPHHQERLVQGPTSLGNRHSARERGNVSLKLHSMLTMEKKSPLKIHVES